MQDNVMVRGGGVGLGDDCTVGRHGDAVSGDERRMILRRERQAGRGDLLASLLFRGAFLVEGEEEGKRVSSGVMFARG